MFMIKNDIDECNVINLMIKVGMNIINDMINGLIILQIYFKQ
jgi:hypothetical protein